MISVTSLAEVWIETVKDLVKLLSVLESLPLRKCGLKQDRSYTLKSNCCHFPCGSVDWNISVYCFQHFDACHFPCGSVDWNNTEGFTAYPYMVTSLAEVWIETAMWSISSFATWSLPLRKCGLKLSASILLDSGNGHFPCGSVDWNIVLVLITKCRNVVTSLAEVWIETCSHSRRNW